MRLRFFAILLAALLQPIFTFAQDISFLVVDIQDVYIQSAVGKKIADERNQAIDALSKSGQEISAALEAEEDALVEQRENMTADEFRPLAADFETRVNEQRDNQRVQLDVIETRAQLRTERYLQGVIVKVISDIRKNNNAQMVLSTQVVVDYDPALDITQLVIDQLDRLYEVRGDEIDAIVFSDDNVDPSANAASTDISAIEREGEGEAGLEVLASPANMDSGIISDSEQETEKGTGDGDN